MASLFWGQANSEPKRQFRFELSFTSRNGNNPGDIPVWAVKTATKPVADEDCYKTSSRSIYDSSPIY
jgi:hypothetical protein